MGICLKDVEVLIQLRENGYLPDRACVVEIGAQQISNSVLGNRPQVERLGKLFGVNAPPPIPGPQPSTLAPDGVTRMPQDAPPARSLWTWLGFSHAAIDIDGGPG